MPSERFERSQAEKEEARAYARSWTPSSRRCRRSTPRRTDDKIARKIAQIQQRKERHAKRQAEKNENQEKAAAALRSASEQDTAGQQATSIRWAIPYESRALTTIGKVESINGDTATAVFGGMRTKMRLNRSGARHRHHRKRNKTEERKENLGFIWYQ